jgi:hypothetical protein
VPISWAEASDKTCQVFLDGLPKCFGCHCKRVSYAAISSAKSNTRLVTFAAIAGVNRKLE